jgi:hypothetical protein
MNTCFPCTKGAKQTLNGDVFSARLVVCFISEVTSSNVLINRQQEQKVPRAISKDGDRQDGQNQRPAQKHRTKRNLGNKRGQEEGYKGRQKTVRKEIWDN